MADDQLVCECELMPRRRLVEAAERRPGMSLDDIRRALRLGMGPCQGGFCTYRAIGHPPRRRRHRLRAGRRPAAHLPAAPLDRPGADPLRRPDAPGLPGRLDLPGHARRGAPAGGGARVAARVAGVSRRVVVVGAGLAGLVAAIRLAREGARVTVVAKGAGSLHLSPGRSTSWATRPSGSRRRARRWPPSPPRNPEHPYGALAPAPRGGRRLVPRAGAGHAAPGRRSGATCSCPRPSACRGPPPWRRPASPRATSPAAAGSRSSACARSRTSSPGCWPRTSPGAALPGGARGGGAPARGGPVAAPGPRRRGRPGLRARLRRSGLPRPGRGRAAGADRGRRARRPAGGARPAPRRRGLGRPERAPRRAGGRDPHAAALGAGDAPAARAARRARARRAAGSCWGRPRWDRRARAGASAASCVRDAVRAARDPRRRRRARHGRLLGRRPGARLHRRPERDRLRAAGGRPARGRGAAQPPPARPPAPDERGGRGRRRAAPGGPVGGGRCGTTCTPPAPSSRGPSPWREKSGEGIAIAGGYRAASAILEGP